MIRKCTRCQKPYGEAIDGVTNAAKSFAPFCSKRCADVDLVHWLKGDYVINGGGSLSVSEEDSDAGLTSATSSEDDVED
ncbi:DNA gyrase inhibitor YacG [Asticcacaulis taihuensis]|uniref:DNA gyrase inhibitor YacG n=1 Tax=Asticcacaulis taihuensis TaxID=260084 RepID=UPI0026F11AD8|nr:DNA gyrase inhibitor YacG [Asticcacaulis taihuensis]